jgi:methyltransferase-like protein/cyclopropane fatty-acyl-phospholipid synthase-like methyltransferase
MSSPQANTYDEVPYESFSFPQTHPDRLATVATLFALKPAPVERCRVLELGCASGGNLVPMASDLPDSSFVGIDLSARQVADGVRAVEELGLKNLELRHASILDVDASYGQFDYVICHGVYSWVPANVQDKILQVCATRLNPDGVAYVSYNTYPGWHLRGLVRDVMRYHARRFAAPADRVRQSRALLNFLAETTKNNSDAYAVLLRQELEPLRKAPDSYLYHEHLEEVNEPTYFHEFAERAAAHGLQYLGESKVGTMVARNFGPEVERTLKALAEDVVQMEQYMDFVRNRMFRESLLVRAGSRPNRNISVETVRPLHVASAGQPAEEPVDLDSRDPAQYRVGGGATLTTREPLLKAAMACLRDAWPGTVPFEELRERARARLRAGPAVDPDADRRTLARGLVDCYLSSDLVELHAYAPRLAARPGERPAAGPVARRQARLGQLVTNRLHGPVRLTDLERQLVTHLDGTRDRAALVEVLAELCRGGVLTVQKDGRTVTDPAVLRPALADLLEQALRRLARAAVLVG